jgi:hypothetical protein
MNFYFDESGDFRLDDDGIGDTPGSLRMEILVIRRSKTTGMS